MKIRLFQTNPPEKDMPILSAHRFAAQTAGGATTESSIFTAHSPVRVAGIKLTFDAALNGVATNNVTVTVNHYAAGVAGTALGALTFAAGVTAAAYTQADLAALLGAALANTLLNAGDVLTLKFVQNGAGLAVPAGLIEINYVLAGQPGY